MKRVAAATVTPLVRFVEWMFGPLAQGIDLLLFLFAAAWGGLMIFRPKIFDVGTFVGMQWLPDFTWIAMFGVLTAWHAAGMFLGHRRALRYSACLFSAWIWITVSASFATIEITTGVLCYGIVGSFALCGALYLSGQPRKPV
ncbi:hypothetical protein [Methylobacterium sp. WL6]|uniref:hypothetical protein n=1 Tax=Methylobacterium sp. WL6 TaxID=2603901 RepID=UPI0011C6FF7D|nr:hypothetical protein [Methylobacterium sp. WL6]TXN71638.1 hypothetical protein FV230_07775 [Methylobacterium sp. WL6]